MGLRSSWRKAKLGDLRASDADRADAVRRLEMHKKLGHLTDVEEKHLVGLVKRSKTPNEIAKAFVGLPALPARPSGAERRISIEDRDKAIDLLQGARQEGRIGSDEYAAAREQVNSARTRSEIEAAFRGLETPSRVAVGKAASSVRSQAAGLTIPDPS